MPPPKLPGHRHTLSTHVVRIPVIDWPRIAQGAKTEVRFSGAYSTLSRIKTPTPLVGWTTQEFAADKVRMFVLEDVWTELLGAISPESVEREGFEDFRAFRAYWCERHHRGFRRWNTVTALRLRPWGPFDEEAMGHALLEHLYGPYLEAER